MPKIVLALWILAAVSAPLTAEEAWITRTGINLTPGLVYDRAWDPGYQGSAITFMLLRQSGSVALGAGAETGYSYTGFHVLVPLRAGVTIAEGEALSLSANLDLMPGLILGRPSPWFLIAAEVSVEAVWSVSSRFSLALSAGPRYTTSPGYSRAVAPLETIDLTVGISAVVNRRREMKPE